MIQSFSERHEYSDSSLGRDRLWNSLLSCSTFVENENENDDEADLQRRLMTDQSLIVIDTNLMPWEERFNEKIGRALYRKNLIEDAGTGMEVRLVRYPAGVINPRHTHPCAHGMFVLEGTLVTHSGSYGPGTFVWFPEGTTMEHGASAGGDTTVVFITNKPFEIHYE